MNKTVVKRGMFLCLFYTLMLFVKGIFEVFGTDLEFFLLISILFYQIGGGDL
ncbi:hypothetical protein P7H41_13115 [Vagococcus fluvialis]|uniref:hypothetical protein n=1 Tax=Vagococcus fluvialis TaxID=2738 RepID=UPI001A8EDC3D|nr:hypothetical protein [Vagococcus fluvialis]MBO0442826.1 hypothetical protein [Vagococcus fluvialis]MDT2782883.1 hypothetical protein [Vagococcus fluvialis]